MDCVFRGMACLAAYPFFSPRFSAGNVQTYKILDVDSDKKQGPICQAVPQNSYPDTRRVLVDLQCVSGAVDRRCHGFSVGDFVCLFASL